MNGVRESAVRLDDDGSVGLLGGSVVDTSIGSRRLTAEQPFIVAEAGINHNGDIDLACRMIAVAKEAGADAIKFQTFKAKEFIADESLTYSYASQGTTVTESMLEMFKRCELSRESWRTIKQRCDELEITFLSTPQNRSDLDLLLELGIPAIKVGSDDLTNVPLLKHYAATGLPMIISTGMADMGDVHQALAAIGTLEGHPTVALVCTSMYPAPPSDLHLRRITTLAGAFPGLAVGFSDHSQGALASTLALALGSCMFEKHFTLDHDLPGPDHWFSADPDDLRQWVSALHTSARMLGNALIQPTAQEFEMRALARRSVVTLSDIDGGDIFTESNLGLRRPGTGLQPVLYEQILGRHATRALPKGAILEYGDFR